ncbi:ectonucleotide pyrophosphatase/phosphodiesterase family member 3-like [Arapaima gigas]
MNYITELKQRKKAIIIGALSVSIVIIILGLGLGLGLQLQNCQKKELPESLRTSCRHHCYEPYSDESPGCRCDSMCVSSGTCCYDFEEICYLPTQQWECTKLRCGEKRMNDSKCHCSDDCMGQGDCCTNFKNVCQGDTEWKEDECKEMVAPKCPPSFSKQPLLLVSLDGFRAEYLKTWSKLIPVIDKLKTCGTYAPYMQAVFPSMTFPNHYTIVTGLYAESHGLIDNNMYDPVFDTSFSLSNSEKSNPRWYLGQPIWHTVMNQGLKAGTYFWPGSDVKINGRFPNIYRDYDGKVPFEERVFGVLQWLRLPEDKRPDFYTLYLEEPDKSGHNYGPVSGGVIEAIQGVDRIIGQLMNGLKQLDLHQCVNIMVVADHGMEETSCNRIEILQDMVGDINHLYVNQGAFGRIRSINKDQTCEWYLFPWDIQCKKTDQKVKPLLKSNLPKRYHYANSRRIEDVVVLVEPKWLFARYKGSLNYCEGGTHGYDNDVPSMQAMFLSYGPKFLYKTQVDPFSNVEVYNLMCDLLEITPAPNNGTHGSLNHILRKPWYVPTFAAEQTAPHECLLLSLNSTDDLGCSCTGRDIIALNSRLNLTVAEVSASEKKHMPFGRPRLLQPAGNYCLLHQQGFVSAYSSLSLMPLWSSFTMNRPENLDPLPEVQDCLRADVRIPAASSPHCSQYPDHKNITPAFLYPPSLNSTVEEQYDALLMSNIVPLYLEFSKIWIYLQNVLLKKYATQYSSINVVLGPAFDYNYDGLWDTSDQIQEFVPGTDIPVPTHYFMVLTSCKNTSQPVENCQQEMQTVSFLIPHRADLSEICNSHEAPSQWVEDFIWFHQSRVRDVELITGLDFYQESTRPVAELLKLKSHPTAAISRIN